MKNKRNILYILLAVLIILIIIIFSASNIYNKNNDSRRPTLKDIDGDGIPDNEQDKDNDGILDSVDDSVQGGELGDKVNELPNSMNQETLNGVTLYRFSGQEVAKGIEQFLSSMKRSDGQYFFKKDCTSERTGPEQVQNTNWALMAYSSLYGLENNDYYKNKLLDDWDISASDKTSAELYTSFQLYQLYLLLGKYPGLLGESDEDGLYRKINSVGSSLITGYEPREDYAMILATLARASYISSKLNDELNLDDSPEVFNNAQMLLEAAEARDEKVLLRKNGVELTEGSCWIQLAKLERFDLTKDIEDLEAVRDYFDALDMDKEFDDPALLDASVPMSLLPCAEALMMLDSKYSQDDYLDDARAILGAYLKYSWDIPERKFCSGDKGILAKRKSSNLDSRKVMTDNAYFVYLFTKKGINNYEFRWLK